MPNLENFQALNNPIDKYETRINLHTQKSENVADNKFSLPMLNVRNTIEKVRTSITLDKLNMQSSKLLRKSAPDVLEGIISQTIQLEDSETNLETYTAKADAMIKKFDALKKIDCPYQSKIIPYLYMSNKDLESLLSLTTSKEIKKAISLHMSLELPKGIGKTIAIELIYSVLKRSKLLNYTLEQTGAILSIYYLTHKYFLSSISIATEDVHNFFKEHILLHSVNCLPNSQKIFTEEQVLEIMLFFWQIYLQYLPLIKSLALPYYAFKLNYKLEPDPVKGKGKGKGKGKKK